MGEHDKLLTLVKKWSRSSGLAKTVLQGTGKGNREEEEVDRKRDEKTILKSGQESLPAQLGQLKTR